MAYYDNIYIRPAPTSHNVVEQTCDFTANAASTGDIYKANTTSDITMTLPESPALGYWCAIWNPDDGATTVATSGSDVMYDTDNVDGDQFTQATVATSNGLHATFYYMGSGEWVESTYGAWTFS